MVAMVATGKEEYRAVQNMKFIQSRHHRNHPQQIKHPVVLPMVKIDMEEHQYQFVVIVRMLPLDCNSKSHIKLRTALNLMRIVVFYGMTLVDAQI